VVEVAVSREADSFARSLPAQAHADFVRCGAGSRPSVVEQAVIGDLTVSHIGFGFDVRSHIEIDDSSFAVARIIAAPPGARWGDFDLVAGQVRSLGAARTHLGINPAGVETLAVVIDADQLEGAADLLGCTVDPRVMAGPLAGSPQFDQAFDEISDLLAHPTASPDSTTRCRDRLLAAIAESAGESNQSTSRSFDSSGRIVTQCLDYARSISMWNPSTVELCRVTGVSDRRVRSAFVDVFNMPLMHYFRLAGLNKARVLLGDPESDEVLITDVANQLGFYHLSRFARSYRNAFGEYPSDTLRTRRAS
jgi:AraC family ethanolamine operon transcriptional activator